MSSSMKISYEIFVAVDKHIQLTSFNDLKEIKFSIFINSVRINSIWVRMEDTQFTKQISMMRQHAMSN